MKLSTGLMMQKHEMSIPTQSKVLENNMLVFFNYMIFLCITHLLCHEAKAHQFTM